MGPLHSAFVHIPIGLLIAYSGTELALLLLPTYRERLAMGKYVMLIIGVIGGLAALMSGDILTETRGETAQIELHAFFAGATIWVYGILACAFTLRYAQTQRLADIMKKNQTITRLWNILQSLSRFLTHEPLLALFALLGGILLFLTGTLGGAIAHGPQADPIVSAVYSFFFR